MRLYPSVRMVSVDIWVSVADTQCVTTPVQTKRDKETGSKESHSQRKKTGRSKSQWK